MDATIEEKLAEQYNIEGYPTIKFFMKGSVIDYEGPHDSNGILSWLQKKTGDPTEKVASIKDMEAKLKSNKAIAVGFFKDMKLSLIHI